MGYPSVINAENTLRNLTGINRILHQFEEYRESFRSHRQSNDLSDFYPNLVFAGNPATGKTTIARLISKILYQDGFLSSEQVIEVNADELVSDFNGFTRNKATDLCNQAKGGLLLVDEAYRLNCNEQGREVCDALVHFMDNNRDTVIVLMGYLHEMTELLENNQSLKRCVPHFLIFRDYTNEELIEMFEKKSAEEHCLINDTVLNMVIDHFSSIPRNESFGNAREVDRLLSVMIGNMRRRLQETESAIDFEKQELLPQDFPQYEKHLENYNPDPNSDVDQTNIQEKEQYEGNSNVCTKVDDLQQSVLDLQRIIENIQYNVAMLVQNQANAADVAVLQRENEAFRSDSNMKLMRRYGIDAMIKTYQTICDRVFRIKHPQFEQSEREAELDALNWVLKRMEKQLKPLGIKLKSSQPGTPVDYSVMVVYGSEGEDVEDDEVMVVSDDVLLKDTVLESVCPAFIWTIPSLIGDVKEWYMEMEKVCIYK